MKNKLITLIALTTLIPLSTHGHGCGWGAGMGILGTGLLLNAATTSRPREVYVSSDGGYYAAQADRERAEKRAARQEAKRLKKENEKLKKQIKKNGGTVEETKVEPAKEIEDEDDSE